ncbi:MAG: sensor histidine kinase [Halanaeroarchaeum sp.]
MARGHVELAVETGDLDELDRATDALDRMDEIIEGVLTLARNGSQVDDPSAVELSEVAREAWTTVDVDGGALNVETGDTTVRADEGRLRRLFENLFRNAADHAGPAPAVTVEQLEDGFVVEDDGPGISDERRDDIFERGFSSAENGTGFGLAIVRNIAEAHGWRVVSVPGDGGARFEFHGVHTGQSPDSE